MKILVACEESQAVTLPLRALGHEAYSCDIQPTSGDHPEWHLQQDVLQVLHDDRWDMVLAFPPCTHLCSSGAVRFAEKRADGRQQQGIDFFMEFTKLDHVPKVAIENPVGIMSTLWRKPDQIIQPYEFGHDASKKTCLWLKGLPLIKSTSYYPPRLVTKDGKLYKRWSNQVHSRGTDNLSPSPDRGKKRSKTYSGIAEAMAIQWAGEI
jgi:hypothetical protein